LWGSLKKTSSADINVIRLQIAQIALGNKFFPSAPDSISQDAPPDIHSRVGIEDSIAALPLQSPTLADKYADMQV